MNDRKYLKDGRAVHLVQALENGKFLVQPLWFIDGYEDEDEEGFTDEGSPIIVDKVLDTAPRELYATDIMAAQEELAKLRRDIAAAENAQRQGEREHAARLAKLKKFDALKDVEDLLEKGVTHLVEVEYGVATVSELQADRDREFPLITLRGKKCWDGKIYWAANQYSDGSGRSSPVTPCTSLEHANAIAREINAARLKATAHQPDARVVEAADRFGIPVPVEYRKKVLQSQLCNLQSNGSYRQAEVKRANESMDAFNKSVADVKAKLEELEKQPAILAIVDGSGCPF